MWKQRVMTRPEYSLQYNDYQDGEIMEKEPIRRYSTAFKQMVVREYEAGASVLGLRQKYGIGSPTTVKRWVEQYSRAGYRNSVVVIQTVDDQLAVKAMKEHIAELEAALAQSVLESRMLKITLDVASQSLGMDLKKNFGKRSSSKQPHPDK